MEVTFGNEQALFVVHTGSSDTWMVHRGFQCTDLFGNDEPEAACAFEPVYNGSFGEDAIKNVSISRDCVTHSTFPSSQSEAYLNHKVMLAASTGI